MSGYKKVTVSISETEYHRLLEAENRLRFQQSNQSSKPSLEVEGAMQQIWRQLQEMESRQSDFLKSIETVNPAIRNIEVETAHQILDQAAVFANDLEAYKEAFIESTQELVAEQGEYFQQAILQAHTDNQQTLVRLQRSIARSQQSLAQKQSLAQDWINTDLQMARFIHENYRHQHLMPGQLEILQQEIDLSEKNLQNDITDGAILGAQQAYMRLSRMRVELEKSEQEWNALQQAALYAAQVVLSLIEDARNFPALDLEGNELAELIPVDLWTNGKLATLAAEVGKLQIEFSSTSSYCSCDDLREFINYQIPDFNERLVRIIHNARKAVLSSQMRINIAEIVVNALESQGFALAEGQYEQGEMKNAFFARLVSLDGSEVRIRVVPSVGDSSSNELFLNNQDAEERTDYELKQRANEITQSLRQFGLRVQNLEQLSAPVDNSNLQTSLTSALKTNKPLFEKFP